MAKDHSHRPQLLLNASILLISMAASSAHAIDELQNAEAISRVHPTDRASGPTHNRHFKPLVLLSPDQAYSAITTQSGKLKYCRTRDGSVQAVFYACNPTALAFSLDGTLLAATGKSKNCTRVESITIKVWDLKFRKLLAEIVAPGPLPSVVAVSTGRVVVGSRSGLHCFLVTTGKKAWSIAVDERISKLEFSADGTFVIAEVANGSVATYSVKSGLPAQITQDRAPNL